MKDSWQQHDFVDHRVLTRLAKLPVLPKGLVEGSFAGMHRSPHHGSSVEFAEYRKYVPGDDVRHIDWRAYGKTDRYYLKEFEADTNMRLYLVLDCSGSMGFRGEHDTKFEYARKIAATLAYMTIHQGDQVGVQAFNDELVLDVPPRHTPAHLKLIFDTLSKVTPKGPTRLPEMLHNLAEKYKRRALVVIMSDFFTDVDELMDAVHHMRFKKHDVAVMHLMDEQELEFSFDRPTRFHDMESGTNVLTEPVSVRDQYIRALRQFLGAMKKGCLERNSDYQMISTDNPFEEVLTPFLLERIKR